MDGQVCQTNGCSKQAALQCPTCIKLSIDGSFFCSQASNNNNNNYYYYYFYNYYYRNVSKDFGMNIKKSTRKNKVLLLIATNNYI